MHIPSCTLPQQPRFHKATASKRGACISFLPSPSASPWSHHARQGRARHGRAGLREVIPCSQPADISLPPGFDKETKVMLLLLTPALAVGSHVFRPTCTLPPWPCQLLSFIPSVFGYLVVPMTTVPVWESFRGASPCMDAVKC